MVLEGVSGGMFGGVQLRSPPTVSVRKGGLVYQGCVPQFEGKISEGGVWNRGVVTMAAGVNTSCMEGHGFFFLACLQSISVNEKQNHPMLHCGTECQMCIVKYEPRQPSLPSPLSGQSTVVPQLCDLLLPQWFAFALWPGSCERRFKCSDRMSLGTKQHR